MAIWAGGACAVPGIIVPVPQPGGGLGQARMFVHDRERRGDRDEDEILEFLALWVQWHSATEDDL